MWKMFEFHRNRNIWPDYKTKGLFLDSLERLQSYKPDTIVIAKMCKDKDSSLE